MNIKQLETFVRVVEQGGFSAAAESLCASQSTVSARIKDLERYLGAELFDRTFHKPKLTAKGHELFEFARQLVEFTASLSRSIRDPHAVSGTVRLGVVGVVANTWLPVLVEKLRQAYPKISLRVDISLTRVLMDRLRNGLLDLAIVAGDVSDAALHQDLLGYDHFAWMAAPSLKLPKGPLSPAQLQACPILTFAEESHHYPVISQWFMDGGIVFKSAMSCNNMDVLASVTMKGVGVSLLPRHCYRQEISEGRLIVLDTVPAMPRVAFSLVYRTNRMPVLAPLVADAAKTASDLPLA